MIFIVETEAEKAWLEAYYPGARAPIGEEFNTAFYLSLGENNSLGLICPARLSAMRRYDLTTDSMVWLDMPNSYYVDPRYQYEFQVTIRDRWDVEWFDMYDGSRPPIGQTMRMIRSAYEQYAQARTAYDREQRRRQEQMVSIASDFSPVNNYFRQARIEIQGRAMAQAADQQVYQSMFDAAQGQNLWLGQNQVMGQNQLSPQLQARIRELRAEMDNPPRQRVHRATVEPLPLP